MAGIIRVEREILGKNIFGALFVGPDTSNLKRVNDVGVYPARLGVIRKNISVRFLEVAGESFLQATLPYLHTLQICVYDYQDHRQINEELIGKMGGLNIGAYQIESLGGRQTYLGGRVRILSLEAAEEAARSTRHFRAVR